MTATGLTYPNILTNTGPFVPQHHQLPPVEEKPLEEVFSIFHNEWVWDFFFCNDEDEVDQLLYAASKEVPATIDVTIASQDCGNSIANSFRVNENIRSVSLTSYCTSNIRVGFLIVDVVDSLLRFVSRSRYTCRFAINNKTAEMIVLTHDPDLALSELQYVHLQSQSKRCHMFALFETKKLLSAIHTMRQSRNTKSSHFSEALVYRYETSENQPCPHCSSFSCNCPVQLRKHRHGHDAEAQMQNLAEFASGCAGRATLKLVSKGIPVLTATYPSCAIFQPTSDAKLMRELSDWAIRDSMSRRATYISIPRGLGISRGKQVICMKRIDIRDREVVTPADNFLRACIITEIEEDNHEDQNESRCQGQMQLDEKDMNETLIEMNKLLDESFLASRSADNDVVMQTTTGLSTMEDNSLPLTTSTNPSGNIAPDLRGLSLNDIPNVGEVDMTIMDELFSSETSMNPVGITRTDTTLVDEDSSNSNSDDVLGVSGGISKTIARRPLVMFDGEDSYSERARLAAAEVVTRDAEERQRRTEERRKRNRLAAAKSNERRRQAMERLKTDITKESKKEKLLREKEGELRRRNALLREKLRLER